jgi:hypothetical protein
MQIRILIRIIFKIQELWWLIIDPRRLTMQVWRHKMVPWRVCRPMGADSHYCDEVQYPDPDTYHSEKSDPDPQQGSGYH